MSIEDLHTLSFALVARLPNSTFGPVFLTLFVLSHTPLPPIPLPPFPRVPRRLSHNVRRARYRPQEARARG